MCVEIADAYASLHARGFLHGDVQPSNVLVVPDSGAASLVDFGLAVRPGASVPTRLRGGVATYLAPEAAAAALRGEDPPPATEASEQYALGAMLFALLTGHDYLERRLGTRAWNAAVATEPPRELAALGLPAWPRAERALARALAKNPDDRYASVAGLRDALVEVAEEAARAAVPSTPRTTWRPAGLLDATLARLADPAALDQPRARPTATVNLGAAGVAWFLLRASGLLHRADLLAAADLWIEEAKRAARQRPADAFTDPVRGLDESTVGTASLYHGAFGVHVVDALVALALDQRQRTETAVTSLVAASRADDGRDDVVSGGAGRLIGVASVLEAATALGVTAVHDPLRGLGDRTLAALLGPGEDGPTPVHESCVAGTAEPFLGVAHGWAGVAFAASRYVRATGEPVPPGLTALLTSLADAATPDEDALAWSVGSMDDGLRGGWCHGAAGHTLLWASLRRTGLAVGAGARMDCLPPPGTGHLCCGAAGQAYAYLALARTTGDGQYVDLARGRLDLATGFVGRPGMAPGSLFKGDLAVALLEHEVTEPDLAAMPAFESEWPG